MFLEHLQICYELLFGAQHPCSIHTPYHLGANIYTLQSSGSSHPIRLHHTRFIDFWHIPI